jgi:hypothetical protein
MALRQRSHDDPSLKARRDQEQPIVIFATSVGSIAAGMPGALILATADLNADVVLTGDEQWLKASRLNCEVRYIATSA